MGGLLLFEGEELILRFRPHPVAYLRRYLTAFLWLIPGAIAGNWPTWVAGPLALEWGLVVFIGLSFTAGLVARALFRTPLAFTWFACLTAAALIFALLMGWLPPPEEAGYPAWFLGVLVGAFLALSRLFTHEADRVGRLHFLTTERLVIRGGLRSRRERTLSIKKIQEIRSEQPVFGRFFDFGNISLVQSRTLRGRDASLHEDIEALIGVAPLTELKFNLQQLVEESRMSPKDRQRRLGERRIRDSMRRLAGWMRRGGPGKAQA